MLRQVTSTRVIPWEQSTLPMNFAPTVLSGGSIASPLQKTTFGHPRCPQVGAVAVATQKLGVAALRWVGSVAEVACQEVGRVVTAEAPKYLVMVLPWAVKVERLGKEIAGVEVEEAHWKSSGYQINNFRMEDGFGTWGEAEMARLKANPTR
jgi:hypothetical protein